MAVLLAMCVLRSFATITTIEFIVVPAPQLVQNAIAVIGNRPDHLHTRGQQDFLHDMACDCSVGDDGNGIQANVFTDNATACLAS
jgi:hypothetical protein